MNKNYDDIINLPHHVSTKYPQMSLIDRAAQFAPFSALSGLNDAIKESARLTDRRVELDELEKEALQEKLNHILEIMDEHPEITLTYFQPDLKKKGGTYLSFTGNVKKIDEYNRVICMMNGRKIRIDEIIEIKN